MGDLRNKFAKLAEAERVAQAGAAWLRRNGRPAPAKAAVNPVYRCQGCGQDHYHVTVYVIPQDGWPRPPDLFYCEPCGRAAGVWPG